MSGVMIFCPLVFLEKLDLILPSPLGLGRGRQSLSTRIWAEADDGASMPSKKSGQMYDKKGHQVRQETTSQAFHDS